MAIRSPNRSRSWASSCGAREGSTIALTDAGTGALTSFAYHPYGSSSAPPPTFGYTGQRFEAETGLYFYRARHYSPAWGRFLQPDPAGYSAGLNLYAYVNNDPLNATDPTGLDTQVGISGIATIAVFVGIGGSLSFGINIPDNPWNVRGYGLVGSAQGNIMAGGGIFGGVGTSIFVTHNPGPISSSVQTSSGWYMEADLGWGGSAGVSVQGTGPLFSKEMEVPNSISIGVNPGVGAGAYVGYGSQASVGGAFTIGDFLPASTSNIGTSVSSYFNQFAQTVNGTGLTQMMQATESYNGLSLGVLSPPNSQSTWK
jgi:RHS repeat-associated protein